MGRFGFGARTRRRKAPGTRPLLVPSQNWNGNVGSGFTTVPADPVRTTAKPVLRLVVAPFQWYDSELVVGVYAAANHGGTLLDNMGIGRVIAHYEGTQVVIDRPSLQSITDANGNRRAYFGWWFRLQHDGRNGHAHLYFEAVPKDTTMQHRVIGPYQFSPQATVYSHQLTVAASTSEIAGSRYKTIQSALNYLKSVSATNPRITITEAGSYVLDGVTNGWANGAWANGYVHIEASAPVSIIRPVPAANADPSAFRPSCGLHLKGQNITLDFANAGELWTTDTVNRDHWLDGIRLTNSKGRYDLYRKTVRSNLGWLMRQSAVYRGAWVTECTVTYLWNALLNTSLARGNTIQSCWSDLFTHSMCVVGNRVDDHDSTEYIAPKSALTVTYGGTGATATLERAGNTFTARVNGGVVGTFTVAIGLADFNANTNYTVANVVNWLNSLPGFAATLLDDSLAATFLAQGSLIPGTFPAQNLKGTMLTLKTWIDVHADWWQRQNSPATMENVVMADNVTTNFVGQIIFWGEMRDGVMINNAWHHKDGPGAGGVDVGLANSRSQIGSTQRHVIHAHNSSTSQRLWLRTDGSGQFNPDAYCLFANNVFPSFEWMGPPDADLLPKDNHMFDGYAVPPSGTAGTTQGGTMASLFGNPAAGDFSPRGALLAYLKSAVVPFDQSGNRRGTLSPAGATI